MKAESVSFKSADGLTLEGELDIPRKPRGTVIVCHAHPRMQGTMRSPLLLAIRDDSLDRHLAVLRFNFRGVGESEGEFADGVGEVADVAGALAFVGERLRGVETALVGWSFGAAVALRTAAADPSIAGCVAIAPATKPRPGISAGLPNEVARGVDVPLLIVCGSNDDIVAMDDCRTLAKTIPHSRIEEIKAANHFFWAKYEALTETVGKFLQEILVNRS